MESKSNNVCVCLGGGGNLSLLFLSLLVVEMCEYWASVQTELAMTALPDSLKSEIITINFFFLS